MKNLNKIVLANFDELYKSVESSAKEWEAKSLHVYIYHTFIDTIKMVDDEPELKELRTVYNRMLENLKKQLTIKAYRLKTDQVPLTYFKKCIDVIKNGFLSQIN
jgi:hypothetical protein